MATTRIEGRHECYLAVSHLDLAAEMRFRGFTVTSLYEAVRPKLPRSVPFSRSTVGHLRAGLRRNVRPEVAREIEKALNARPGSFFSTRVSNVSREGASTREAGMASLVVMVFGFLFLGAVFFALRQVIDHMEELVQMGQWLWGSVGSLLGGIVSAAAVVVSPHMVMQRLTVEQAAKVAGRSTQTIYRAVESGELHGSQRCKGGRWSIRPSCLDSWLDGAECEHQKAGAA